MRLILGSLIGFILVGVIQGFADDFIPWSEDRKLTWDDFLGIPGKFPENYERPDPRSRAFTWGEVKLLDYDYEKVPSIICQYQITKIESLGMFNKNQSWFKEEVLDDPEVLNHEQGHFDIMEIFARKTEGKLLFKIFPCPTNVYDEALIHNEIRKLASAIGEKAQEMHDEYDKKTDTSKNSFQQKSWDGSLLSSRSFLV